MTLYVSRFHVSLLSIWRYSKPCSRFCYLDHCKFLQIRLDKTAVTQMFPGNLLELLEWCFKFQHIGRRSFAYSVKTWKVKLLENKTQILTGDTDSNFRLRDSTRLRSELEEWLSIDGRGRRIHSIGLSYAHPAILHDRHRYCSFCNTQFAKYTANFDIMSHSALITLLLIA